MWLMDNLVVLLGIMATLGTVIATLRYFLRPIDSRLAGIEHRLTAFQGETKGEFAAVRSELREVRDELRGEMAVGFADAAADRKAIRAEMAVGFADAAADRKAIRAEMQKMREELKGEMATGFADAATDRQGIRVEIQVTRKELRADISAIDYKYDSKLDRHEDKLDTVRGDILAISRDLRPNADSAFRLKYPVPIR
jgi:hypothetical protein